MILRNKEVLEQVLVPGIADYNARFVEAYERTIEDEGTKRVLVNGPETVIMKMSDISSIYVEKSSSYLHGDSRTITVTLQNKFRYEFTYQTGHAIRLLWKRYMKDPGLAYSYDQDYRALSKVR